MSKTLKQISWNDYMDDAFEEVSSESDTSYRHGTYEAIVLKDAEGRYWRGHYTLSGDGEHNSWRDDDKVLNCTEVFPHTVSTVVYKEEPQQP